MFNIKTIFITANLITILLISNQLIASPINYTIDNQHTHIVWKVDRFGFTKTIGSFSDIQGELSYDEEDIQNSNIKVTIELGGLLSDLKEREDIIRGPYWLNASEYPTIYFHSDSITLLTSNEPNWQAKIQGEMSLKGISAPLTLIVSLNKVGTDPVTKRKAVGFTGHGSFNRSEFGIKTALGPVGNSVTFQIELLAVAND